jgi:hypothetical protein
MYIFLSIVSDRCIVPLPAAANQSTDSAPGNTSEEAGLPPPDSLPSPPAPASAAITPLLHIQGEDPGTRSPVVQASNYTDLASVQYPLPGSTIPIGGDTGPITQAPPLVRDAPDSLTGTLDRMSPSHDLASHAEPSGAVVPLVPEGSASDDEIVGSTGDFFLAAEGNPVVKPAVLLVNGTGAPDHRTGSRAGRNAKVAPVRLFSKAAIYPYASQGLSCQGANSTVLSSTGGATFCLDVHGASTSDGASVWPP